MDIERFGSGLIEWIRGPPVGSEPVRQVTYVRDAEDRVTHYDHDVFGNLSSQLDARDHLTLYEHDLMGRRLAKELPLGQRETFTYTLSGRVEHHWPFGTNPSNDSADTLHEYEAGSDRLLSITHPASGSLDQLVTSWASARA